MLVVQSAGSSPQGTENGCGQQIGSNITRTVEEDANNDQFAHLRQDAQKGITNLGNLEVGVFIINELLSGGYVKGRTRLGITGMEVSDAMVALYQMPQGFMISEIGEESAFTGTEAREGDIITAIDGETVTSLSDISNLLLKYAPGDTAEITLYRQNGTELKVTVTLLEDKGETQK